MQDFTKPFKLESSTASVATNSTEPKIDLAAVPTLPPEAKKGFIEARKNKDNFWNLMFAVGMTFGFSLAFMIIGDNLEQEPFPYPVALVFWLTIIGVPLFVKSRSKVTFTDGKFFNSENAEININKLSNLGFAILITAALTAFTGVIADKYLTNIFGTILILACLFFIPTLFFILKNCPISILFNLKIWTMEHPDGRNAYHQKHDYSTSSSAYFTDQRFSHLPNNVYNRDRLK